MKRSEMLDIQQSRENLIGFLHLFQIAEIDKILDKLYSVRENRPTYTELCEKVISFYDENLISNKAASNIFEILKQANTYLKTESHRFEYGKIYEYSKINNAYVFMKHGSYNEFIKLNHYID